MRFVFAYHANLNYALLRPEKREEVARVCYGGLLDFYNSRPGLPWVFEASGFTLDFLADRCPDVLDKLRRAVHEGSCEPAGSPYAHSILTSFPEEDGAWALRFGIEAWERHVGVRPRIGWNPEFAWKQYVPYVFRDAGYEVLICDYDSYIQTARGVKLPSMHTHTPEQIDKLLPIDPADPYLHRPVRVIEGLTGVAKTDRVSVRSIKYFQGAISLDEMLHTIDYFAPGEGYVLAFCGDAEYVGTTAWYDLRHRGPEAVFAPLPEAFERLAAYTEALLSRGRICSIREVIEELPVVEEGFYIADGHAGHHNPADQWEKTPQALELDPECERVRTLIKRAEALAETEAQQELVRRAWWHLVQGECADGRYPKPPLAPGEYNVRYCRENLARAEECCRRVLEEAASDRTPA